MKKLIYLFLALIIVACSDDDRIINDTNNTLEKEWLYTHTALEATATSSTTLVIPFTEDIFAFTDRPNREFKYISGDEFASYWNDYDDENSFKLDPPNAVLTWVDADGVEEVEVVITDADFDGTNVIYTIENTTITANQSFEDVSLFVDSFDDFEQLEFDSELLQIKNTWDIFSLNSKAIQQDFDFITEGRKSAGIPEMTVAYNKENIFIEDGAKLPLCSLNAIDGPIYIGENAEIMEGSSVRGPFALCDNSTLKMGTKIYGGTTIGPHSKVGGEVNNSVIFGYSNKGHDGFLGNAVIGEWCNLGAGTNNSNCNFSSICN